MCGASLALVPATTLARGDVLIEWGRSCGTQPGLSLASPEAVLNALWAAPEVLGREGRVGRALPHDDVLALLAAHGRLA